MKKKELQAIAEAAAKNIKTEDELDVPSFLRQPLFSRQRQAVTPADKVTQQPVQSSRKWF